MFISIEGSEGSGKSTLIDSLKAYFDKLNEDVIFTKEPGGTPEGKLIRDILLDSKLTLDPMTEIYLLLSDRVSHVEKLINPALNENKIVISDRYIDSTFAYQGAGRKINKELIKNIFSTYDFPKTNLTIYLDIPVEEGLNRIQTRNTIDRFEEEEISFFERIREYYLDLCSKESSRVKKIDAKKSPEEVLLEALKYIENL